MPYFKRFALEEPQSLKLVLMLPLLLLNRWCRSFATFSSWLLAHTKNFPRIHFSQFILGILGCYKIRVYNEKMKSSLQFFLGGEISHVLIKSSLLCFAVFATRHSLLLSSTNRHKWTHKRAFFMNKWPFCPNANCLFVTALRAQCQNEDKITLKL